MKTRNLLTVIGICLTVLAGALVLVVPVVIQDNRELRRELRTMRADLQRSSAEVGRLRDETSDATARLVAKEHRLEALENQIAEANASAAKAADETGAAPAAPRAFQVRTYVGSLYLGMGWLLPSARPKNPETGQVTYEPVVVLDESLKRNFVAYRTNVVEREVSRETTINYNYPYPYWYYPVVFWHGTNQPPKCDTNQPPGGTATLPQTGVLQPGNSKPFLSTRFYVPREKPFLPPVNDSRPAPSKVRANLNPIAGSLRPQVVGGPDTQRKVTQPWLPPGS